VSRLRVDRDSVYPVFADRFDGVAQTSSLPRRDTIRVTVPGALASVGSTTRVILESSPVEGSGGHLHNGERAVLPRPAGTFFLANQRNRVNLPSRATQRRIEVDRPIGRDTSFIYRTSGIGGQEWLKLRRASGADTVTLDSVLVAIHFDSLVPVAATTNFYFAQSDNHGLADRNVLAGVFEVLDSLFTEWRRLHDSLPARYPFGEGRRFRVDATSLPSGGMLDVHGVWRAKSHSLHKEGLDVDVNNREVEEVTVARGDSLSPRARFVSLCAQYEFSYGGRTFNLECDPHANRADENVNLPTTLIHFHIFIIPVADRPTVLPGFPPS